MISVRIRRPFLSLISKKPILIIVNKMVLNFLPGNKTDLGILICSNEEITTLNQQYRGVDRATDVLSFSSDEIDPETGNQYLGDIVISCETAAVQAKLSGHDLQTEIFILLIHGFLHLLGYDHDTIINKEEMWRTQFNIHKTLGIEVQSLPGDDDQPS